MSIITFQRGESYIDEFDNEVMNVSTFIDDRPGPSQIFATAATDDNIQEYLDREFARRGIATP